MVERLHQKSQTSDIDSPTKHYRSTDAVYRRVVNILDVSVQYRRNKEFYQYIGLFVCVEVLRPSQPNGVMSSVVSLPNHTFTGQT